MRLAEIQDGIVINVIVADDDNIPEWCADWPECPDGGPGWSWDGTTFLPPLSPAEETNTDTIVGTE